MKGKRFDFLFFIFLVFCFFIFFVSYNQYQKKWYVQEMNRHAQVIKEDVWATDFVGPTGYLTLAAERENYSKIELKDVFNKTLLSIESPELKGVDYVLDRANLLPQTIMKSDIKYDGQVIGTLMTYRRNMALYTHLIVFSFFILIYAVIIQFRKIVQVKKGLEGHVIERTKELNDANEKLLKNLKILNKAQEISHLGHFEYDIESQNLVWSDEVYRIFKRNPDIFTPTYEKYFKGQLHPEDRSNAEKKYLDSIENKESFDFEARVLLEDGTIKYIQNIGQTDYDQTGEPIHTIGMIVDITSSKKAAEELRESESLFSQMFEQSTTSMCLYEPDGTIYRVNSEFCRMFGVENNVIMDAGYNVLKDQAIIDAGIAPILRELFDETKTQSWEINFDIDTASKSTEIPTSKTGRIFLEVNGYPVLNHHGDLEYVVLQHYDITKRKELETNLQQAHKMESIGTMAGGVAHDFNNILSIIVGNSELALDDIPKWNPAHLNIEQIKDASLRAAGIVKQLLSFSRQSDQELNPVGIKAVMKDSLRFLRSTIPTTVEIREDIMATDETILADPIQINQVIMNLCINASQAMEETGGVLEIKIEKKSLSEEPADHYTDLAPGDYVKIVVSDSGPGIDPEIIGRIFDPYFTTKEMGKGSGMGLSVVHGIVTSHNGAIAVDSKLGKGSTFTILFPVITQKPAMKVETTDEIRGGNEKILFVDDEQAVVSMAGQILERFGYKVTTETNPAAALELFQLNPDDFDLVITDMTMPQMTGLKFSERMKEIRPDIPVIISTGYSSLIDKESAQEKGIAAYVMKPIVKSELSKTIRAVLDK
ncbi:MAG: response regulator [Bacteroidetes bacterium]|nr:response regulator [Bacteroidota bacterium]